MHVQPNSNPVTEKKTPRPFRRDQNREDLFNRNNYFIDGQMQFRSGSQNRSGFNLTLWSWMSALIDTMVLLSISCFSLILFSFLMKTQAKEILKIVSIEPNIVQMFLISFVFSFWVYMVTMRVFMGASLGEWTCQLRLGQPIQRIRPTYVLRVVARTSLLLLTGVVMIPVLSLIFKRDLLGDITGVHLYSLT